MKPASTAPSAHEAAPTATIELAVSGMSCAACVGRVERALGAVPGVEQASVNLATQRATVRGAASGQALLAAIERAGYAARQLDGPAGLEDAQAQAEQEAERAQLQRDWLLATLLALTEIVD